MVDNQSRLLTGASSKTIFSLIRIGEHNLSADQIEKQNKSGSLHKSETVHRIGGPFAPWDNEQTTVDRGNRGRRIDKECLTVGPTSNQ